MGSGSVFPLLRKRPEQARIGLHDICRSKVIPSFEGKQGRRRKAHDRFVSQPSRSVSPGEPDVDAHSFVPIFVAHAEIATSLGGSCSVLGTNGRYLRLVQIVVLMGHAQGESGWPPTAW